MDTIKYEVSVDKLTWRCDPSIFKFDRFVGQDRAIRAIEFGLSMAREGYNIYVAGLTGTGKTSVVKTYIQRLVARKKIEDPESRLEDWCYLHNFADPDRPQMVNLRRGRGRSFRDQISNLLQKLRDELAKAFSKEEYTSQRKTTVEENQTKQQKHLEEMAEAAHQQGFQLQMTPVGPALIPMIEGKAISQAEYLALGKPVRRELEKRRANLLKKLECGQGRGRLHHIATLQQSDEGTQGFRTDKPLPQRPQRFHAEQSRYLQREGGAAAPGHWPARQPDRRRAGPLPSLQGKCVRR
jgi:uncharacterized protein YcgL (UPF0745 family)